MDFSALNRVELKEYSSNSEFEKYSSIVLDKEDNAFKIVTGNFHDKRDAYEKLAARGYVVRKTFEATIFSWIMEHAPNNLTAYMMFSTAFSKWKGNNILNDYYIALLNDIPKLNREKIKGDPNSMALDKVQRESVELQEVKPDQAHYIANNKTPRDNYKLTQDEKLVNNKIDQWMDRYHKLKNVRVLPINQDGSLSKLAKPLEISNTYVEVSPDKDNFSEKAFIDPDFLKAIFNQVYIYHTGEAFPEWAPFKAYQIVVDNQPVAEIQKVVLPEMLKAAIAREKKELDNAIKPKDSQEYDSDILTDKDTLDSLYNQYKRAVSRGDKEKAKQLLNLLRTTKAAGERMPKNSLDMAGYKAAEEIRSAFSKLSTALKNKSNEYTTEDAVKVIDTRIESISSSLNNAGPFDQLSDYYKELQSFQASLRRMKDTLLTGEKTQENVKVFSNALKDYMEQILDRGIKSDKAHAATLRLKAKDNDDAAKAQRQADLYSNPRTSPSNPIRGGDTNARFFDKLDPYVQRKLHKMTGGHINPNATGELNVDESAVNQGATTSYLSTPKQPVMHNNGGIMPLAGTIVEEEKQFNPVLFDGYKLKPEVREALLKVADKFKEKLDLELEPVDIYLTGSNANYNYNDASDIDLHLVYNFEEVGIAAEIFSKYLVAQKKVFNSDYDIYVKGIKVEVGAEDINHPLVAGGVYSVLDDEWRITPEQMPEVTDELPPYMTELINEIEKAIQSNDSEVIGNLWKSLGALRKESLANEGEFGSGNLMFKKLRADGYLGRLKDAYYNSASQELSLESLEEI